MGLPIAQGRNAARGKGTLAGVLAHLHALILALLVAGCGFSGALYLPEEPPPASGEPAAPAGQENGGAFSEGPPI